MYINNSLTQCTDDDQCPWLYQCQSSNCQHLPLFPLSIYPIFIYLLIPLASGLVNMTGNSMGIFKVLLLMNLLRYDASQSTALIQPMVAGAAIPNFMFLLGKKHPFRETSLINFNIVYLLIPSCLYGSTMGCLLGNFIPQLAQDILIVIVFSFFTYKFIMKARTFKNQEGNPNVEVTNSQTHLSLLNSQSQESNPQLQQIKRYESSWHWKDIGISFLVFLIFEFLVFLVQGKFKFLSFGKCDIYYPIGLSFLTLFTLGYLLIVRKIIKKRFDLYELLNYNQDVPLQYKSKYWLIVLGGFSAGMMQGILGTGSGTCMMAVLLSVSLPPRVASATSGYQIFFMGSASLIQSFINENIQIDQIIFFMLLSAVGGGIVTLIFYQILKKKNQNFVNKILVYIIGSLCLISALGIFPCAIGSYLNFGWQNLLKIKFHC